MASVDKVRLWQVVLSVRVSGRSEVLVESRVEL